MTQKKFKELVWNFYREHKRDLPWRRTKNPYRIWVSEVMLQQTQVERVVPKYKSFLKRFPTIQTLAKVPLSNVLSEWQGLGYNRRAKLLHEGAKYIQREHGGVFPKTNLRSIPGIGPYTEAAIQAFAFNVPIPCIETNIRTVYLHHFFNDEEDVTDKDIFPVIEKTLDHSNPREWYWALMDYGAHLKKSGIQINNKSKHYTKQSPFKGSDREIRGAIIKALVKKEDVQKLFPKERERVEAQLRKLVQEGMIEEGGGVYKIAT